MKYVIVDDEINASNLLKRILERYEKLLPEDEIHVFNDSVEAYGFICRSKPDLIFLDIEMPRMTGEELAKRILAELVPKPFIIFITAFPQYSMFAWDAGAVGYILKPYSAKSVYDAIEKYNKLSVVNAGSTKNISDRPFIRCFPDFELFVSGQPVFFKNKKSRELLALLVHNRGNWVSLDKTTFSLFEDLDEASSKNYLRTLLYRLKKTLSPYGIEDIIESRYGSIRINPEKIDCDYYDYLNGNISLFQGEYMGEYTWAQTTRAYMSDNI